MPYNPSTGVYSLPAIYLAIPGTVIIAGQHNTPLEDLATANNYARPVIAGGTGANTNVGAANSLQVVSFGASQVLTGPQKRVASVNLGQIQSSYSANQLVTISNVGETLQFTASATVTFSPSADLGADFHCEIWSNTGVTLTLDPDGSETINGASTLIIQGNSRVVVWSTGTALLAKTTGDVYSGPQIRGYINGLTLSNNTTDPTNDIDIATGSAASDGTTPILMTLGSAITKRLDAAWAVGSGNGGWLDGASMPNGTGHAFLIQRSDTGVSDVGFSASLSPTLPANYDRKRRIGSIIRKSGSILGFTQVGNVFTLNAAQNDVTTTNPGTSAVLAAVSTPVGIKARAQIWVYVQQATSSARRAGLITSPDQTDTVPVAGSNSSIVAGLPTAPGNASGEFFVRTNTSAQIRYRFDTSDANLSIYINTAGWIDDQL